MAVSEAALKTATHNLLVHCARLEPGDRIVVIREMAGQALYDRRAADAVARAAASMGIGATICEVPFQEEVTEFDAEVVALMADADCSIFFARLGDQIRFKALPKGARAVVSYALDLDMLASPFSTAHYDAFAALKLAIDRMMGAARQIRVTCPRGTDFSGPGFGRGETDKVDVTVARFPMSVFAPVPADAFSGQVALAGFLMGTGSRYYSPYGRAFDHRVTAHFKRGRLIGFSGEADDVAAAEAHYDAISERYGIDRDMVHSWHAGIHPGCAYRQPVEDDFARWSCGAFGNPRVLHFHTCGAYAPGEISWNVLDPTVYVDGVAVWQKGRLYPDRIPGGAEILAKYPCAAAVFDHPETEVGITDAVLARLDA